MLTTNDKTIKLWKLAEKDRQMEKQLSNGGGGSNLIGGGGNGSNSNCDTSNLMDSADLVGSSDSGYQQQQLQSDGSLRLPKYISCDPTVQPSLRRMFSNAHSFHINSISVNSDQETYISADELRINLWNLEVTDESFGECVCGEIIQLKKCFCLTHCLSPLFSVIVDIKPTNMEELTEVITAAEFHPQHCNIFAYSTSKGAVKLCDMRAAALCDQYSKSKSI